MVALKPTINHIWDWLDSVPDPEIPVISVVDLGVIRNVAWQGDTLEIAVTPTYSGCPATSVIAMDIETAMQDRGLRDIRITTQIAPAWTTDWLSEKGRAKLTQYGIAPPSPSGGPDACKHQIRQRRCVRFGDKRQDDAKCGTPQDKGERSGHESLRYI